MNLAFTPIELIVGCIACVFAVAIGAVLAKHQARVFSPPADMDTHNPSDQPIVNHIDYGDLRFLHLGTPWVQGSMRISKPYDIHLEYVQRMMAWLLVTDLDQVQHLKSMQLGLGAASLTKFCHLKLGMPTTAVELNSQVIETCRHRFNLPKDNANLHVLLADAADIASQETWHGKIDALQVDLYDQEAACPTLDSQAFYTDCRNLLTEQGCMTVNLYGRNSNLEISMERIVMAFGKEALWAFKPTKAGNTIVLAFRTPRGWDKSALYSQAQMIQRRWSLPAENWLKELAPLKG
jgi:spermidine synthase